MNCDGEGSKQSLAHSSNYPLVKLVSRASIYILQVCALLCAACERLRRGVPLNTVRLDMFAREHDENRMGGPFDEQAPACVLSAGELLAQAMRV